MIVATPSPAAPARLSLCILRANTVAAERDVFLQRHHYLGLTEAELAKIVLAIREDGLSESLLADYDAEVSEAGHHSFAIHDALADSPVDETKAAAMRHANQALSSSYRVQIPASYQFSQPVFDRALQQFVEVYASQPTEAAMLLYLHIRAAQQQYWRYSTQADWRQWVYFEHHRQALVWIIERYGTAEQVARIRQDRHLVSTVNIYSGELDRGFGPVLAGPVQEKMAFYQRHFGFDDSDANTEPVNFADDTQAVSYQQQEPGALDRQLAELWPQGSGRLVADLFAALAKDCQR